MITIEEVFKDSYQRDVKMRNIAIKRCIQRIEYCKQQIANGAPIQGKLKSYLNQSIGKNNRYRIWQFVGVPQPPYSKPNRPRVRGMDNV